jgi:hypothetical protein
MSGAAIIEQAEPAAQESPATRRTRSAWRSRLAVIALALALAGFFAWLVYINCYWCNYPDDNDLDEVAWLSAHLSLSRPESFANQGYPPGLPVVLRLLTPLVGSFLRAAFLWQSIAATVSVFFVHQITVALTGRRSAGAIALVVAALAGLPVFTSEFADGTSTALFLGGLYALVYRQLQDPSATHSVDRKGFFWFGLAAGASYLFRTHYLMLLALVPACLIVAGLGWREIGRGVLAFAAGFAATAWPLWLMNLLAYGTPLNSGVSQYNIALAVVPHAFSWEDYPNTYNQWPLSRILHERPWDLVDNSIRQALNTLSLRVSLVGAALGCAAMVLVPERQRRRLLVFSGALALVYVFVIIVPTRYTDRAFAPVAMLCSVLVACGASELLARAPRPRWAALFAVPALLFTAYPIGTWPALKHRAAERRQNERIVQLMVESGMRSSAEVFSNDWNFYNLADPNFDTFYNYGGWIELDSEYARERPHPNASTPEEWQQFFEEHGIRFAVLRPTGRAKSLAQHPPGSWSRIYAGNRLSVYKLK